VKTSISPATVRAVADYLVRSLDRLWTYQDIATHLKIDHRNLRPSRRGNKIPPPDIREGNFMRWFPQTILTWEQKNRGKIQSAKGR
jgi:hypothetical protein